MLVYTKQNLLEKDIAELEAKIKNAEIIHKAKNGFVELGSTVEVQFGENKARYTIVGSAEAKPEEGKISNESPLGKAFLGKRVGEEVQVETPGGATTYKILVVE